MFSYKVLIFILISVSALVLGAVFILPSLSQKEFVRIQVGGADVIAEIARDSFSRARGLSGRGFLPEGSGMLFIFDKADRWGIWMKGMRFPIDILWIKEGVLVDMEERAVPPAGDVADSQIPVYRPDVPADFVLEVNAGFVDKHKLKIGDRVRIFSDNPVFRGSSYADIPAVTQTRFGSGAPQGTGSEYYIEVLRQNPPRGKNFKITEVLEKNSAYQKFSITYEADGRTLTGVMNIPRRDPPPSGWPILILNHGLIFPEVYYSGRGSRREQDFFARNGYATIHPDYRWHALSPEEALPEDRDKDSAPRGRAHHDFYVGYTRDVLALIEALKALDPKLIDTDRIGMWGHSMGGGIAERVMVLAPEVRAYVLFAPISADVEDNFFELPQSEIDWLRKTYGRSGAEVYKKISPLTYFKDVSAPVQIHYGDADKDVPIEFSEKIAEALAKLGKRVEIFTYPGEGHEFGAAWQIAAERALQFFDRYVKNAR